MNPKYILLITVFLLSSCSLFVRKEYRGSNCLPKISHYLISENWELTSTSDTELEFRVGNSFVPTFDYEGDELEVQVVIKKNNKTYSIEVGNYGLYIELVQMKPRFARISETIDGFIKKECEDSL